MVCNGFEIASGGIRNHIPELMVKAFGMVGLDEKVVEERFGGLYRAFQYGAFRPMAAWLPASTASSCCWSARSNLREVTMFPMNQQAQDLLMGAPGEAEAAQLRELNLRIIPVAEGRVRTGQKRPASGAGPFRQFWLAVTETFIT